jgi:2-iminobutanoate/2-iminopropanoate deaminase
MMMFQMRIFCVCLLLCGLPGAFAADKKPIRPPGAPPSATYTPGIVAGGTLYVAGQLGRTADGKYPDAFEDEVKLALEAAGKIIKEAGYTFADAVSVQVYLTDMDTFDRMNKVYVTFFPDPKPVRTTVGVARLVGPARIEVTVTCWKSQAGNR